MPFNSETASQAGKKSSRGSDKANALLRKTITGALSEVNLKEALAELSGFDLVRAYSLLVKYAIPALSSIELDITDVTVKEYLQMSSDEQDDYINSIQN